MYRMLVFFKFGRMTNEVEYIRATQEECQSEIDAVLDVNPALEYEIVEQGAV